MGIHTARFFQLKTSICFFVLFSVFLSNSFASSFDRFPEVISIQGSTHIEKNLTIALAAYRGVSVEDLAKYSSGEYKTELSAVANALKEYLEKNRSWKNSIWVFDHLEWEGPFIKKVWVWSYTAENILEKNQKLIFEKLSFELRSGTGIYLSNGRFYSDELEVIKAISREVLKSSDVRWKASVDLIDRRITLVASESGLVRTFPLDVGSIDRVRQVNGLSVLTTQFKKAELSWNFVIPKRDKPKYYRNKPFVRVTVGGQWTKIGFHIEQQPGFKRGFLSHGCMRLRSTDLYELASYVKNSSPTTIELSVNLSSQDGFAHPYPHLNSWFNEVKNFGTAEVPYSKIEADEEGVLQVVLTKNRTSLEDLEKQTLCTDKRQFFCSLELLKSKFELLGSNVL